MTKLMILHLSDLHFSSKSDSGYERAQHVISAISNLESDIEHIVIVASGDLTLAGSEEGLYTCWDFIDVLKQTISSGARFPALRNTHVVSVPGNHDCDFSQPNIIRESLLSGKLDFEKILESPEATASCLLVQTDYFEMLETFGTPITKSLHPAHPHLAYEYRIATSGHGVRFLCFNTSWLSTRHEVQGKLYVPVEAVPTKHEDESLTVAVLHHPLNWLSTESTWNFRPLLENFADVILTGHEHQSTSRMQNYQEGPQNLCLEAGAFQEPGNTQSSEFSALIFDLENHLQKIARFKWRGDLYSISSHTTDNSDGFGLSWEPTPTSQDSVKRGRFQISEPMVETLESVDLPLGTSYKQKFNLSDLFVYPDLETVKDNSGKTLLSSENLLDHIQEAPYLIVLGDRDSGKSSLSKMVFVDAAKAGYVPLWVAGSEIPKKPGLVTNYLFETLSFQYQGFDRDFFLQSPSERKILIVDNFHDLVTRNNSSDILREIRTTFGKLIGFTDRYLQQWLDVRNAADTDLGMHPQLTFSLLPLGHKKRFQLIEKWHGFDPALKIDPIGISQTIQNRKSDIDALVGRKWMPAYPTYLLTILQSATLGTMDHQIGTQGALYEVLIKSALLRLGEPLNYNISLHFLGEYCYRLFANDRVSFDDNYYTNELSKFAESNDLRITDFPTQSELTRVGVLKRSDDLYEFTHHYIYLFFVAVGFKHRLTRSETKEQTALEISGLVDLIGQGDNTDVLLFLAHVAAEEFFIDRLMAKANSLFSEFPPVNIVSDVPTIANSIQSYHEVVLDPDTKTNRSIYLERKDRIEAQQNIGSSDQDEPSEFLIAIRAIEVMGQLLKNFPASLDRERKTVMVEAAITLSRRVLGFMYGFIGDVVQPRLELVLSEEHGPRKSTERELTEEVEGFLSRFLEVLTSAMLLFASDAIGSAAIIRSFQRSISADSPLPEQFVKLIIDMRFSRSFPERDAERLIKDTAPGSLARSILFEIIVGHFYLIESERSVRHRILNLLNVRYPQKVARRHDLE